MGNWRNYFDHYKNWHWGITRQIWISITHLEMLTFWTLQEDHWSRHIYCLVTVPLFVGFPLLFRVASVGSARAFTSRIVACVADDSFPFLCGDRTSEWNSGRAKEHGWGEQKNVEKWGGGEREGGGGGAKRNRLQSIPNILSNSVRPRTGSNSVI